MDVETSMENKSFEVYKLMVEDANQKAERRDRLDSLYVTLSSVILAADAYVGASSQFDNWLPVAVTACIGIVGIIVCLRWIRGIRGMNLILDTRYDLLRRLEALNSLNTLHADLFTQEFRLLYDTGRPLAGRVKLWFRLPNIFVLIYILVPCAVAMLTLAAADPSLHQFFKPLFPASSTPPPAP